MRVLRNLAGVALGVALLATAAVAQDQDVPLGDVARQQSGKKAVATFDDDNFKRTAPAPAPSNEAKAADAKPAPKKADGEAKAEPSAEVKALEKQVAELQRNRDFFASQIATLQARASDPSVNSDIRESLAGAQAGYREQLAEATTELAKAQKQLDAARAAQKPDAAGGDDAADDSSKEAPAKPADNPPPPSQ